MTKTTKPTIYTNDYEVSHGKKPRGTGTWAFYEDGNEHNIIWAPPRMGYTAAVRWFNKQVDGGVYQVAP